MSTWGVAVHTLIFRNDFFFSYLQYAFISVRIPGRKNRRTTLWRFIPALFPTAKHSWWNGYHYNLQRYKRQKHWKWKSSNRSYSNLNDVQCTTVKYSKINTSGIYLFRRIKSIIHVIVFNLRQLIIPYLINVHRYTKRNGNFLWNTCITRM